MKTKKLVAVLLLCMFVLPLVLSACKSTPEEKEPENPIVSGDHVCGHVCPTCQKCYDATCTKDACAEKCQGHAEVLEKHLITDEEGNYGGTFLASRYGEGAPLNGALDTENDPYYTVHNYYDMLSTGSRTMISHFRPYQQTMANSDGIACMMMILFNEGEDITLEYNEASLVDKYETLNKKTVYKNGTTAAGLEKLFKDCGYEANGTPVLSDSNADFADWIETYLRDNYYVMVKWQAGLDARWMLIVGYDTLGTESISDDVIIFADPFDASDHYQDGFYIYHFSRFFHWWKDMGTKKTGTAVSTKDCVVVPSSKKFDIVIGPNDPVHNNPEYAELHRLLNKDGTIGGRYGDGRYSMKAPYTGSTGYDPAIRQATEHVDYSYYTFPDYYNMPDSDTRLICTGYRAYTQTMASSCGICSTMSILEYYGYDWVSICDLITRTDWYGYETDEDKKFGPIAANDYGMKQEAIATLYMQGDSNFDNAPSTKFYSYGGVGSTKLYKVPKKLGYTVYDYGGYSGSNTKPFPTYEKYLTYMKGHLAKDEPMVIGWNPTGGHYEVVFGLDDMGTATPYDDVIILGDSSDGVDHYKDGFNTLPAVLFYGTWYNGSGSWNQQYVMFGRPAK